MQIPYKNSVVLTACIACLLIAQSSYAHQSHGSVALDGRFTPNVEGAQFPPQPRDMSSQVFLRSTEQTNPGTARQRSALTAQSTALLEQMEKDPDIAGALGDDYLLLSEQPIIKKWSSANADNRLFVFFSYAKNQSVEVLTENGVVESFDFIPAGVAQPALAEIEMSRAVDIASAHWRAVPGADVSQLIGYAIQTFEPDGSPHSTRVAYVSFHRASPELPEYLTWVDLNTSKVIKAERAQ